MDVVIFETHTLNFTLKILKKNIRIITFLTLPSLLNPMTLNKNAYSQLGVQLTHFCITCN